MTESTSLERPLGNITVKGPIPGQDPSRRQKTITDHCSLAINGYLVGVLQQKSFKLSLHGLMEQVLRPSS